MITCDTQPTSLVANNHVWDDRITLARAQGMSALADITIPRWFPSGCDFLEGNRREAYVHDMISNTAVEGFVVGARALQGYELLPGLAKVLEGKKLLIMAGERDGVLPTVLKTLNENLLKEGVNTEFVVVPGAGHIPMLDAPKLWLDLVEKFLD